MDLGILDSGEVNLLHFGFRDALAYFGLPFLIVNSCTLFLVEVRDAIMEGSV